MNHLTFVPRPRSFAAALVASLALVAAGCEEDIPHDTATSVCERLDDCNSLGTSVGECVDVFERCANGLTTAQQEDWARKVDACLSYSTCEAAFDCYVDFVPWC